MLALLLVLLNPAFADTSSPQTLQTFGVGVERGRIVHPLPSTVALGLFNPDPLLDVAYYADGRVRVYQNLGNGTFGTEPVWEMRARGEVEMMEWRKSRYLTEGIFDPNSWGDLVIHYGDGRSETVTHTQMLRTGSALPAGGFGSLPPMSPPLNFTEVWRSEPNPGGAYEVEVGDIDNDGKTELVYFFNPAVGDSTYRLVVYECVGNDSFVVDWDTVMYTTTGGPFDITDIDNDGHQEIVTAYFPRGVGTLPSMSFLECYGPRQYRYYFTNIGFQRPLFKAKQTDVNHNGVRDLTVLGSDPSAVFDETLIYVAEFVSKGPGPNGWQMAFNQQIARYQGYTFEMTVGQVDGQGWDEIIPAGGSFGFQEPVPVDYLWYSGVPGPELWKTRGIYTGLQSGTGAVMFVNLDADTTMEFVSGAPGPVGHGSMFALKYVSDTTWSVMWADSNLRSAPLWVNSGDLDGQFVAAGANVWTSGSDTLYGELHVYQPSGLKVGAWRRDSLSIQQFHLLDIDNDGRTNLIFAQVASFNHRLMDYESDTVVVSVNPRSELPQSFELLQNYPNPFNPTTTVRFHLPQQAEIELSIYNILGKEVRTLLQNELEAGVHAVQWDGTTNEGGDAASGVYFYRMIVRSTQGIFSTQTRKMLLLR